MTVQQVLGGLYEADAEEKFALAESAVVTLRVDGMHWCLLGAVADRFKTSRAAVAGSLLESGLEELFGQLTPADRQRVAKQADDIVKERYGEQVIGRMWSALADALDGQLSGKGEAA